MALSNTTTPIYYGMNASKRALDKAVDKEEAARIFKANNIKKIDSFWKVSPEDKDDD